MTVTPPKFIAKPLEAKCLYQLSPDDYLIPSILAVLHDSV